MSISPDDIQPAEQFVEENPEIWRNMAAFNWASHNREKNGLAEYGVIVKRGNKNFIVKPRLVDWLLDSDQS